MSFAEVAPTELADGVTVQIRDAILMGHLQPGDVLPSERELTRQFRVNRTTIREGLNRLEHLGLIERRQGTRCRVLDYHRYGSMELVPALVRLRPAEVSALDRSAAASTNEAVRIMYEGAVELAAQRITPAEVELLEELATSLEVAIATGDVDAITAADRSFHHQVARATHSVVLELLVASFYRSMDAVLDESGGVKRTVARALQDLDGRGIPLPHRRLVAAIAGGRSDEARGIVRRMMGHLG